MGGGEGDRTSRYQLGWRAGVKKAVPDADQGVKQAALDPVDAPLHIVSTIVGPDWSYPAALPLGRIRIGPLTLATLPFEVTTSVGAAARRGIQEALPGTREEIVGLADEYASYAVSDPEYDAQDYMGAFTLWGPRQARHLVEQLKHLAALPGNGVTGARASFSPGISTEFRFDYIGSGRTLPESDLGTLLSNTHGEMLPVPRITWLEANAGLEKEFSKVAIRSVVIERLDGAKGTETEDEHFILVLVQNAPSHAPVEWAALWGRPVVEHVTGTYRFVVTTGDSKKINGTAFTLK